MDSDEDAHYIVEDTDGATYITLRSIIEDHEHTLLHATTPQTAALINTLRHQFAEHIRTNLYTPTLTPYTNKQFSTAPTLQSTTSHSHHHHSSFTQTTASFTTHPPFPRPQPTLCTHSCHSISASYTLAHPHLPDLPPHPPLHHQVDSVSTPYVAGAKPEYLRRGPSAADTSTASAVNTEDSSHLNPRKHT